MGTRVGPALCGGRRVRAAACPAWQAFVNLDSVKDTLVMGVLQVRACVCVCAHARASVFVHARALARVFVSE